MLGDPKGARGPRPRPYFKALEANLRALQPARRPRRVAAKRTGSWRVVRGFATYHIESENGVNLDSTVEVAEQNRHGQKEDVHRIANVVSQELDELADEHPHPKRLHGQHVRLPIPWLGGFVAEENEQHITQEGRRRQRCQMDGVGAPRLAAATQTSIVSVRLTWMRFF